MEALRLNPLKPQPVSGRSRLPAAALICAAVLLLQVVLAGAQSPDRLGGNMSQIEPAEAGGKSARPQADRRIREGTQLADQLGYFRVTGDRVTFFADDGKAKFVGLENLNLQRIARAIADNPVPLQWSVTGTVTEYHGSNFLLVRRAVLKTRVQFPRGAP